MRSMEFHDTVVQTQKPRNSFRAGMYKRYKDEEDELVHGVRPHYLVEKITRLKIYEMPYFKEKCFGLTSKTLVDRAVALKYAGGTHGGTSTPTRFLCLLLKMLMISPETEIVLSFIRNKSFKYVALLGAVYLRLVGSPVEIYTALDPLLQDYSKVRVRVSDSTFIVRHMDEIIDDLLTQESYLGIALPRLPERHVLVGARKLTARVSRLTELEPTWDVDTIIEQEKPQPVVKPLKEKIVSKLRLKRKKVEKGDDPDEPAAASGDLDIEEWNAIRAKLGIKALK